MHYIGLLMAQHNRQLIKMTMKDLDLYLGDDRLSQTFPVLS